MQIVAQTKQRSGWPAYRTLAALGVPRSVYHAWKRRDNLVDQVGTPCRVYEVLPEERAAICEFALRSPRSHPPSSRSVFDNRSSETVSRFTSTWTNRLS
jgi:hypothetical protein